MSGSATCTETIERTSRRLAASRPTRPWWRNGRRRGLKILWGVSPVRVRVPPTAFSKCPVRSTSDGSSLRTISAPVTRYVALLKLHLGIHLRKLCAEQQYLRRVIDPHQDDRQRAR